MNNFQPDIDPNSKTIEMSTRGNGCIGIIVEGEHKGTCFAKDKKGIKMLQSVPNELKEAYNHYMNKND